MDFVRIDKEAFEACPDESVDNGERYQVKHITVNPGVLPLQMIEVQSDSHLGEDDIVRFEDKYGRA